MYLSFARLGLCIDIPQREILLLVCPTFSCPIPRPFNSKSLFELFCYNKNLLRLVDFPTIQSA